MEVKFKMCIGTDLFGTLAFFNDSANKEGLRLEQQKPLQPNNSIGCGGCNVLKIPLIPFRFEIRRAA
jgi:hypothetical protein